MNEKFQPASVTTWHIIKSCSAVEKQDFMASWSLKNTFEAITVVLTVLSQIHIFQGHQQQNKKTIPDNNFFSGKISESLLVCWNDGGKGWKVQFYGF